MFDRHQLSTPEQVADEGVGMSIVDVARAIGVWTLMNWEKEKQPPSVADCALAFNTSVDLVREAVAERYWLFLIPENEADPTKQFIENEGE